MLLLPTLGAAAAMADPTPSPEELITQQAKKSLHSSLLCGEDGSSGGGSPRMVVFHSQRRRRALLRYHEAMYAGAASQVKRMTDIKDDAPLLLQL